MLPKAKVIHQMPGRIRIRVKGNIQDKKAFFEGLRESMKSRFDFDNVQINPVTGSLVLFQGKDKHPLDTAASVRKWARKENLFFLEPEPKAERFVVDHSRNMVERIDRTIRKVSSNHLDMGSSVFLLLIFHALREVAAGNLVVPSWFTALWFASSIYNRKFSEADSDDGHHDSGDMDDPGHS